MLLLARLVGIAVVVELYVSVVGWYEHKGAEVCMLASLQYSCVQGECSSSLSVMLLAQDSVHERLAGVLDGCCYNPHSDLECQMHVAFRI